MNDLLVGNIPYNELKQVIYFAKVKNPRQGGNYRYFLGAAVTKEQNGYLVLSVTSRKRGTDEADASFMYWYPDRDTAIDHAADLARIANEQAMKAS